VIVQFFTEERLQRSADALVQLLAALDEPGVVANLLR